VRSGIAIRPKAGAMPLLSTIDMQATDIPPVILPPY
jgi:hypothetical protein